MKLNEVTDSGRRDEAGLYNMPRRVRRDGEIENEKTRWDRLDPLRLEGVADNSEVHVRRTQFAGDRQKAV